MTRISIPTLETERLILRAHRLDDFPAYARFLASDRARHMGGPVDERAAWSSFCRDVAQWTLLGHGALAIETRESGAFAGQVGLNRHPYFDERELGWLLFEGFEGKGLAQEAARALRDWAWRVFPDSTIVSYIHTANDASIRLAERLGATRDPNAKCAYADHGVWRHPVADDDGSVEAYA